MPLARSPIVKRFQGKQKETSHQSPRSLCSYLVWLVWLVVILWFLFLLQYTYFNNIKGDGFDLNSMPLDVGGALANDINSLALKLAAKKDSISNNLRGKTLDTQVDTKKMNEMSKNNIPNHLHESKLHTDIETEYTSEVVMHIVFSTDCSFYQDWQTLLVFHSASAIKQPGTITRIASGCNKEKQAELNKLYKILYPHGNYNVHFTPVFKLDGKTNKKYDFYNKPYGMEHWLDHSDPRIKDGSIIALIDPDMILLRNITHKIRGETNNIFTSITHQKLKTANHNEDGIVPIEVKKGQAAAQLYQLGAPWTTANRNFNRTDICGIDSPCMLVTRDYGEEFFSVGPPYILEKSDMLKLTKSWVKMVPLVYEKYPNLLAEMYAYSMAAAHTEIPHFTVTHYMVSNTEVYDEGWKWIDVLQQKVCERPDESGIYYPGKNLPTVMHYCQFFRAGEYGFQKRRVSKNMFECNPKSPLLIDPPDDLAKVDYKNRDGEIMKLGPIAVRRNAFALCVISRSINSMIIDYKTKMCRDTPNFSINRNVTINVANLKY